MERRAQPPGRDVLHGQRERIGTPRHGSTPSLGVCLAVHTVRQVGDRIHPIFLGFGTVEDVAALARARARDDIVRLVHHTTGVDRFARDAMRVLERALPFDAAGMLTVDPATLLPTALAGVSNGVDLDVSPRFIEIEVREPDYNKFSVLARHGRRAASLSTATRGDLDKSTRYRELCRPLGFGDEMRVVCSDSTGAWGDVILARESRRRRFNASEVSFIGSLAPLLADGLRRAAILGQAATSAPACDRHRGPRCGQLHRVGHPRS